MNFTTAEMMEGLCPICGEAIRLINTTKDGRLIGSCQDAFTLKRWAEVDTPEDERAEGWQARLALFNESTGGR